MKFCTNCDNMYYMQVCDNDCNKLIYYCRHCGHKDETISNEGVCVLDNQIIKSEQKFNHIINPYTKLDPTLPSMEMKCPNATCKTNQGEDSNDPNKLTDIIYMRFDDTNLKYVYICPICDFQWISK